MNGICTNTPGGWRCSCPPDFLGDGNQNAFIIIIIFFQGFRCVPSDAPYEIYLTSIPEIVIDICNFGLVKFNFSIDETFDRPVSELCIDVISSDAAARTDPSIVYNVVPFYKYEVSLLADLTDLEERPSIHFCPCGQQCLSNNDAPIALIDDECNSQSKGSS